VTAYLVKPFRQNELLPAIEQVLTRAGRNGRSTRRSSGSTPRDSCDDKIETRRMVDEAKAVLMDRHDMSEADASPSSSARP